LPKARPTLVGRRNADPGKYCSWPGSTKPPSQSRSGPLLWDSLNGQSFHTAICRPEGSKCASRIGASITHGFCTMSTIHPGVTGRKVAARTSQPAAPTLSEDDPIAALPPFVSIKRTCEVLCISRATVWRRIKDGTLQRVGTGKIAKASIRRYAQPRPLPVDEARRDQINAEGAARQAGRAQSFQG